MARPMATKQILVSVGENHRVVCIHPSTELKDTALLKNGIKQMFADILPPRCDFYIQMKSAEWGGVFIDVDLEEEIAEKSVVNVVLKSKEVQIHSKIHRHCLKLYINYNYRLKLLSH